MINVFDNYIMFLKGQLEAISIMQQIIWNQRLNSKRAYEIYWLDLEAEIVRGYIYNDRFSNALCK